MRIISDGSFAGGGQAPEQAAEGLLSHTNAEVRFAAACALAPSRSAQDPRIFREIGARLEFLGEPALRGSPPALSVLMRDVLTATEALQSASPSAKPLVPALLRLASESGICVAVCLRSFGLVPADPHLPARKRWPPSSAIAGRPRRQ